jgi:hypothetical protein
MKKLILIISLLLIPACTGNNSAPPSPPTPPPVCQGNIQGILSWSAITTDSLGIQCSPLGYMVECYNSTDGSSLTIDVGNVLEYDAKPTLITDGVWSCRYKAYASDRDGDWSLPITFTRQDGCFYK